MSKGKTEGKKRGGKKQPTPIIEGTENGKSK
jgi:hypothetical protein